MAFLKTAAKVLPLALRRRGRDYLVRELVEWNPLAFVRNKDAGARSRTRHATVDT